MTAPFSKFYGKKFELAFVLILKNDFLRGFILKPIERAGA